MASPAVVNGSGPEALPALPTLRQPTLDSPKAARSVPDSSRRHSLPLNILPQGLWNWNASSPSLVESEEAARGEHILDEGTVANRILALRQLNGATRSQHQYAKSTGARNSTFNQPVIVRTYSGPGRPRSQQRDIITAKQGNGVVAMASVKMDLKLPPVEAFSFKGIMDEIRNGVADDLERIAEICARSKYSLSNQYEVHMPPHGRGESFPQPTGLGVAHTPAGRTLQEHPSDDEQPRRPARGPNSKRRAGVAAQSTLETIMSSSRSSDEDKSKKKPAAVLANEIRGRAAKQEVQAPAKIDAIVIESNEHSPPEPRATRQVRSKSISFASMVIDNAHGTKNEPASQILSSTNLVSEPAQPLVSADAGLESNTISEDSELENYSIPTAMHHESRSSPLRPATSPGKHSVLGSFSSWLSWSKSPAAAERSAPPPPGRTRSASNAEGSLRDLLKHTEVDRKGKGVDRRS